MAKKIKYDKMHGSEKAYRITMLITYLIAALAVLSSIFTVPNIDEHNNTPLLAVYSVVFVVYVLLLAVCAALATVFFKKTGKEYAAVQAFMLYIATAFTAANFKMFLVFFFYGVGLDSKVEKLFGTDMRALTDSFTAGWMMLAIGFGITMLLGVLSIVRLASKKYS